MPIHFSGFIRLLCSYCSDSLTIGKDLKWCKKFNFNKCCAAPVCENGFNCTHEHICRYCKKSAIGFFKVRKSSLPYSIFGLQFNFSDSQFSDSCPLKLTWDKYYRCVEELEILMRTPRFREFLESYQFPLQWHDHLRLRELFHQYLFLRPASLQLASMFRMRMCMHMRISNASVFGLECHKITQMLALCRANGVRVIHPRKIHAHFGFAFLCATRISTEFCRQKSEDGSSVAVCSKTYWRTMIPWIIRWITRLPK
jgi:hypothetical protein